MPEPDRSDDDRDLPVESDDPDLDSLLEHADLSELESHVPLARRLVEAAGEDDPEDFPTGALLVEGLYLLTGGSYDVGGRNDSLAWLGFTFALAPERMRTVVRFWRKASELGDEELQARVAAVAERARRKASDDAE